MNKSQGIVLITDADSDVGCERARQLVTDGQRVVVTARHPSRLTRILLGQSPDQVIAIAADLSDPIQRSQLLERARKRLGRVRWVVDGRTGSMSPLRAGDSDFAKPAVDCASLAKAS